MTFSYNEVVRMLREGVITVTFKKVDGSQRVMKCTLQSQFLPEEHRNKGPMLTETTGNTIPVWDVEASAWRSFRLDSITNIQI